VNIPELITLLSNKIASLNNARSNAVVAGNIDAIWQLDGEIAETQESLDKIKTL